MSENEDHLRRNFISDDIVISLRKDAKLHGRPRVKHHARRLGLSTRSVERSIAGISFKHLDDQEPPFKAKEYNIKIAKEIRHLYLDEKKTYKQIVKILGVSLATVSKYCKDVVRSNRVNITPELKATIRKLYLTDLTTPQVAKHIGVDKRVIQKLCSDLVDIKKKQQAEKRKSLANERKPRSEWVGNGPQMLTDQQVIDARREARASGVKDWETLAAKYGVACSTMSSAVRGISFKHVNDQEPPIAPGELKNKQGVRRRKPAASKPHHLGDLVDKAIEMRRSDPVKWTYRTIGGWLSEQTGKNYQPGPVAILLRHKDPTIKNLETPKVAPILTPEQRQRQRDYTNERRLKERQSLRVFMENEDRRDRGLAELSPSELQLFLNTTTKKKG